LALSAIDGSESPPGFQTGGAGESRHRFKNTGRTGHPLTEKNQGGFGRVRIMKCVTPFMI